MEMTYMEAKSIEALIKVEGDKKSEDVLQISPTPQVWHDYILVVHVRSEKVSRFFFERLFQKIRVEGIQ